MELGYCYTGMVAWMQQNDWLFTFIWMKVILPVHLQSGLPLVRFRFKILTGAPPIFGKGDICVSWWGLQQLKFPFISDGTLYSLDVISCTIKRIIKSGYKHPLYSWMDIIGGKYTQDDYYTTRIVYILLNTNPAFFFFASSTGFPKCWIKAQIFTKVSVCYNTIT